MTTIVTMIINAIPDARMMAIVDPDKLLDFPVDPFEDDEELLLDDPSDTLHAWLIRSMLPARTCFAVNLTSVAEQFTLMFVGHPFRTFTSMNARPSLPITSLSFEVEDEHPPHTHLGLNIVPFMVLIYALPYDDGSGSSCVFHEVATVGLIHEHHSSVFVVHTVLASRRHCAGFSVHHVLHAPAVTPLLSYSKVSSPRRMKGHVIAGCIDGP